MIQLVNIYNEVEYFKYVSYQSFKNINNRRTHVRGSRSRSLVQFINIGFQDFGVIHVANK